MLTLDPGPGTGGERSLLFRSHPVRGLLSPRPMPTEAGFTCPRTLPGLDSKQEPDEGPGG